MAQQNVPKYRRQGFLHFRGVFARTEIAALRQDTSIIPSTIC